MTVKLGDIWVIYCHTAPDGRRYVGQTKKTMMSRWAAHVREARSPKWGSSAFIGAIRRFGPKAFKHEQLEVCFSIFDANKAEAKWIERFDTCDRTKGFNTQTGGTFSVRRAKPKT